MKRRRFAQYMAGASLLANPSASLLLRLFDLPEYTMKPLRGNVGYFTERGGTILWMVEDGAAVVVDTQFPEQAGHLIEEMAKKDAASFDYVINTHHHGDHSGGNIAFKGIAKTILAHANSKVNQKRSAEERGTLDSTLLPDETFTESWSKQVGSEIVTLQYWGAGHTNGDALIHFENANVVHVGDLVFNRRYPYIDKGAGASISNWIRVLEKARNHFDDETIFVCGHSGNGFDIVIDKGDIKAFEQYLANVLTFVGGELKAGKTEEEILAATEIPGSPEWQGKGIQRSLTSAITELRDEK